MLGTSTLKGGEAMLTVKSSNVLNMELKNLGRVKRCRGPGARSSRRWSASSRLQWQTDCRMAKLESNSRPRSEPSGRANRRDFDVGPSPGPPDAAITEAFPDSCSARQRPCLSPIVDTTGNICRLWNSDCVGMRELNRSMEVRCEANATRCWPASYTTPSTATSSRPATKLATCVRPSTRPARPSRTSGDASCRAVRRRR